MKLEGRIKQVIFYAESTGYCVAQFQTSDGEIRIVGHFPKSGFLNVEGDFVHHNKYGEQFSVRSYEVSQPEDGESIEAFLSEHVEGVGPFLAKNLVKAFGKETLEVIEKEPERLLQVEGIGKKTYEKIVKSYEGLLRHREIYVFLAPYQLTPLQTGNIIELYGERAKEIIEENPYELCFTIDHFPFEKADAMALDIGFSQDHYFRCQGAINQELKENLNRGNTYLIKKELIQLVSRKYGISFETVEDTFETEVAHGNLRLRGDKVFDFSTYSTLEMIGYHMKRLSRANYSMTYPSSVEIMEESIGLTFDVDQRKALENFLLHPLSIVTGGPGTGKTAIIRAIIEAAKEHDMKVALAAPTGRAAKVMEEATGVEASTIHRLLEYIYTPSQHLLSFERNSSYPLEAQVLIIDEMSMVDLFLFEKLLDAIADDTKVVFIGDIHQLPSVAAGNVLRDLIHSRRYPTSVLKTIYRQEASSDIPFIASKISKGEADIQGEYQGFSYYSSLEDQQIYSLLFQQLKEKEEVQVLCPNKRGKWGVHRLNQMIQKAYHGRNKSFLVGKSIYYQGDRVMMNRNTYDLDWVDLKTQEMGKGIFNGEQGVIREIDPFEEKVMIVFNGSLQTEISYDQMDDISLSYAMTVHKSQGSQYAHVLLFMMGVPYPLCHRQVIYTAVTRAQQSCWLIANPSEVRQSILQVRQEGGKTALMEFLGDSIEAE